PCRGVTTLPGAAGGQEPCPAPRPDATHRANGGTRTRCGEPRAGPAAPATGRPARCARRPADRPGGAGEIGRPAARGLPVGRAGCTVSRPVYAQPAGATVGEQPRGCGAGAADPMPMTDRSPAVGAPDGTAE